MISFISGLIVGALGMIVIAFLIYRNNNKKIKEAIVILEGPGTSDEKIKKVKALFF